MQARHAGQAVRVLFVYLVNGQAVRLLFVYHVNGQAGRVLFMYNVADAVCNRP